MNKNKKILFNIFIIIALLFSSLLVSCKSREEERIEEEKAKMSAIFASLFDEYDMNNIEDNLKFENDIEGYNIIYKSNNLDAISDDGVIYRGANDKIATVEVVITNETSDVSLTKTFNFNVKAVSPMTILESHNATGIYKIKGIVSAINNEVIYIEDSTAKTKVLISSDYIKFINQGDEVIFTYDDSSDDKFVDLEVLSSGNQISKKITLSNLLDSERNYYRRADIYDLVITDISFDQFNLDEDILLTLSDGNSTQNLSINKSYLVNDEDLSELVSDLEIGDVLTINDIVCDDYLYYTFDSSIERTNKTEIVYSSTNSINKEGIYYVKGKVVYDLYDFFIIADSTGNKVVLNPNHKVIEVGKSYSVRLEAVFSDNLEITLKKIKEIDQDISVSSSPIYVNGYLINLILDRPIESNLYVEMIGEIVYEEGNHYLIPFGTTDIRVSFNRDISDAYLNENVSVVGYLNTISNNEINMIIEKIEFASDVVITPLIVKIDSSKKEFNLYDVINLKAIIYPEYANFNNNVTWEYDNNNVIKLDENGLIKAVNYGKVTVTAITGNNLIDRMTIEIKNVDNDYNAYLLFGSSEININSTDSYTLRPLITKFDYQFTYDEAMISVDGFTITPKSFGKTDLIVNVDGVTDVIIHLNIIQNSSYGYDSPFTNISKEVVIVKSKKEFNEALINGYLNRYTRMSLKFDYFVESSNPVDLIDKSFYEIGRVEFNTYYIEKDRTIQATFYSLDSSRATVETTNPTSSDPHNIYINDLLKHLALYENGRSEYFEDFKIFESNLGVCDIWTCQELYLMLEKGYAPNFPSKSSYVYFIFNEAKKILRNIVTDDMNDYLKVKAIYDYIVLNCELDKDATVSTKSNLKSNDLEGAFSGLASEEGLAKMFVVLCRIEGIKASLVRGENRYYSKHWNTVNIDGVDYLVSLGDGIESSRNNYNLNELYPFAFSYINYNYFLTNSTMFRDTYPQIVKGSDTMDTLSYNVFKDELIYNSSIDYQINSQDELNYLFSLISTFNLKKDYYIYISSYNFMIARERIQRALDFAKSLDQFIIVDFTRDTNNKVYGIFVKVGNND